MNRAAHDQERARWVPLRDKLDVLQPQAFFIESEHSHHGTATSIATILLTNRECPWRCIYCDLWKSTTTKTVPIGAIPAQIDLALAQLRRDERKESNGGSARIRQTPRTDIKQLKLYNAGSFFDRKAVPPEDFAAIAERVCGFERVIVESHPALIGSAAIVFHELLVRKAGEQKRCPAPELEVAMGLEVADDLILARMNKRMTLAMFERAAAFLLNNGIALRAFVIVKPPFVKTDVEALDLAQRSIDFAFDCGASVVSLIPARFGPVALDDLARTAEFAPPGFDAVEEALDYGVAQQRGRVFVDLWDIEKLGGCCACTPDRVARLREVNLQQSRPPRIVCARAGTTCLSGV